MVIPARARLGTGDVADLLGCSREWVARQCGRGAFPCLFVAGRYRFTAEDVAAILALVRRAARDPPRLAELVFCEALPADARVIEPTTRRPPIDWRHY